MISIIGNSLFKKNISKIGLGTVQFGLPYGITNKNGKTPEKDVKLILNYAKEVGIDVLDTASCYGTSEKVLGKNDLTEFKIVSKFILHNIDKDITIQLRDSLADLKIQALYGYMAHRPLEIANNLRHWDELIQLKEKNLINKIGFSYNEIAEIEITLSMGLVPDIIQVPYNYLDNRFEPYMKELKKRGCEIHARSPFLQGLFFSETNKLNSFFDDVKPIIKEIQVFGNNLPKMLLKYCSDKTFVDKVIFGVNTLSQLKDNIENFYDTLSLPLNKRKVEESILIPSKWPK